MGMATKVGKGSATVQVSSHVLTNGNKRWSITGLVVHSQVNYIYAHINKQSINPEQHASQKKLWPSMIKFLLHSSFLFKSKTLSKNQSDINFKISHIYLFIYTDIIVP